MDSGRCDDVGAIEKRTDWGRIEVEGIGQWWSYNDRNCGVGTGFRMALPCILDQS